MQILRAGFRKLLEAINGKIDLLVSGGTFYNTFGLITVQLDNEYVFGASIYKADGSVFAEKDITAGTFEVYRIRAGVATQIVGPTASNKAIGRVYTAYNFSDSDWDNNDIFYILFHGITADDGVEEKEYPDLFVWGQVSPAADISTAVNSIYNIVNHETYGNNAIYTLVEAINNVQNWSGLEADLSTLEDLVTDVKTVVEHEDYGNAGLLSAIEAVGSDVEEVLIDTGTTLPGQLSTINSTVNAIKLRTDKIPNNPAAVGDAMKLISGAIVDTTIDASAVTKIQAGLATGAQIDNLNDISGADVQAAVLAMLNLAINSSNAPTAKSLRDILNKNSSYTYNRSTDSLEAISDAITALRNGTATVQGIYNLVKALTRTYSDASLTLTGSDQDLFSDEPSTVKTLFPFAIFLPSGTGSCVLSLHIRALKSTGPDVYEYYKVTEKTVELDQDKVVFFPSFDDAASIPHGFCFLYRRGVKIKAKQSGGTGATIRAQCIVGGA